jgi:hypothetical protein
VRPERVWRCVACGRTIALDRDRISLEGAATRAFVNPAGVEYVIAGFREAEGCVADGERSTYWSWFAGFSWQVALCGGCGAHLGWNFQSDAQRFYGLLVDRLSAPSA